MSRTADGLDRRADPQAGSCASIVLLSKMIRAHGLNPVEAEEAHPEVMRALRTGCMLCKAGNHCVRALRERTAAAECQAFCLNAPVLNALAEYERIANTAPLVSMRGDRNSGHTPKKAGAR